MNIVIKYIRYIRITKALKIKRTKELNKLILKDKYVYTNTRGNGKTTAIMIYALVNNLICPQFLFDNDTDYNPNNYRRRKWYWNYYLELRNKCLSKHIRFEDYKCVGVVCSCDECIAGGKINDIRRKN